MVQRWAALLRASIGRKLLMSLTGLALIGYLVVHLAGNLQIFAGEGGEAFDAYAKALEENPLLPLAEVALAALFVAHIALGLRTALANREARPRRYKELASHGRRNPASMSMLVTGVIVLVFLVIHVIDFRILPRHPEGLAATVVRRLATPVGAAIYLVGVAALGLHLWHAFQSSLQTLGVNHPRYTPAIKKLGFALALLLAVGFASFPVASLAWPDLVRKAGESARAGPEPAAPIEAPAEPAR
jgi:succinate dehydrogenase / fumarate reductase cytochrome b subunit